MKVHKQMKVHKKNFFDNTIKNSYEYYSDNKLAPFTR